VVIAGKQKKQGRKKQEGVEGGKGESSQKGSDDQARHRVRRWSGTSDGRHTENVMNNLVALVGRIGQDPILRYTNGNSTPVANTSLATNTVYRDREGQRQEKTEWHRIVVWGEPAKNFEQIVGKGNLVSVQGRLEYRTREIAGQRVQEAVIRVTAWTQLTPKRNGGQAAADPDGDGFQEDEAQLAGDPNFPIDLPGEGDLPTAGIDPFAENPPADQEPVPADSTATTRRRRTK
jgi:single-strand DNA-binding protein